MQNRTVERNKQKRFTTIRDLMNKIVLPEWIKYLRKKIGYKTSPSGDSSRSKIKDVVINKKILRDLREFYRI